MTLTAQAADAVRRSFATTYRSKVMELRNRWLHRDTRSPALTALDEHRLHCFVRDFDKLTADTEHHVRVSIYYALQTSCTAMQVASCYSFVMLPKTPPRIIPRLSDAPESVVQEP
jgi:hypothetical protein